MNKRRTCSCKQSRCLKLYCECFASGQHCLPGQCNCQNCCNNSDNELLRAEAVEATLERNPLAFRPKVAGAGGGGGRLKKGCNCKRSSCLKRYCECFQAGVLCSDKCRCHDCKNFDGSHELRVVLSTSRSFQSNLASKKRAAPVRVAAPPPVAAAAPPTHAHAHASASGAPAGTAATAPGPAMAAPGAPGAAAASLPVAAGGMGAIGGGLAGSNGERAGAAVAGGMTLPALSPEAALSIVTSGTRTGPALAPASTAATDVPAAMLQHDCLRFLTASLGDLSTHSNHPVTLEQERDVLTALLRTMREVAGAAAQRHMPGSA